MITVPKPKPFLVEVLLNDGETWSPIISFGAISLAIANAIDRGTFGQTARVTHKDKVVYTEKTGVMAW